MICFLLFASFIFPKNGFCLKGRELVFAATGAVVAVGGITLMIKSAKKSEKSNNTAFNLEVQPWFPMKDPQLYDFKKIP